MQEIPITKIVVEYEMVDGKKCLKKLPDGSSPVAEFGKMLIQMDRDYRREHNDLPLIEVATTKAKDLKTGLEYHEVTIYSLETGERKAVSKAILIDKATGNPATIDPKDYIPKAESIFHVGQMLTHEVLKAEAKKRGLQLRSETINQLDKIEAELESK